MRRSIAAAKGWEQRYPYEGDAESKKCTKCGETKPLSEFYKKSGRASARRPYFTHCRTCHRAATKAWKAANAERAREASRVRNLAKLGLTSDAFDALLAAQGGGCAICGDPSAAHVDHDHSCCPAGRACSQCVRGILCVRCNIGLGQFLDDPERLRAALQYLSKPC